MRSKQAAARRVRRMWDEVSTETLQPEVLATLAEQLQAEHLPTTDPEHQRAVLAAVNVVAAARKPDQLADRSFREALDQRTHDARPWRIFDALFPQLALLPWTFWLLAAALFGLGSFLLPFVGDAGPMALVATIPLLGLVSCLYTIRASSSGVWEWEQSCPITPLQLALARVVVVLMIAVAASTIGSIFLISQGFGFSLVGFTVSWLSLLLLIIGLYLVADVIVGGVAGGAVAAITWFAYVLLTQGSKVATSVTQSTDGGLLLSVLDIGALLLGVLLLIAALAMIARRDRGFAAA